MKQFRHPRDLCISGDARRGAAVVVRAVVVAHDHVVSELPDESLSARCVIAHDAEPARPRGMEVDTVVNHGGCYSSAGLRHEHINPVEMARENLLHVIKRAALSDDRVAVAAQHQEFHEGEECTSVDTKRRTGMGTPGLDRVVSFVVRPAECAGAPPTTMHAHCFLLAAVFCFVATCPEGVAQQFPAPQFAGAGASPVSLLMVDFDGDAKPDAVSAGYLANQSLLWLNNGLGDFGTAIPIVGTKDAVAIEAADLNNDGVLDLVAANQTGDSISLFLVTPPIGFGSPIHFPAGAVPQDLALADFDQDGVVDAAVANLNGSQIQLLKGVTGGAFLAPVSFAFTGGTAIALATGHFNNDSAVDLVVADGQNARVGLYLNTITGFNPAVFTNVGAALTEIGAADLNLDGKTDAYAVASGSTSLYTLTGNGTGGFSIAAPVPVGATSTGVDAGDVDLDGIPDLVTANFTSKTLRVLRAAAPLLYDPAVPISLNAGPSDVRISDVNGDGRPDLATALNTTKKFAWIPGHPAGVFHGAPTIAVTSQPRGIAFADFDQNGFADLVTANQGTNNISYLSNTTNGGFNAPVQSSAGQGPVAIAAADVTLDGNPDAIVATATQSRVSIVPGNGAGQFSSPIVKSVGQGPAAVVVADLTQDGRPDIVTANTAVNNVSIVVNQGSSVFANQIPVSTSTGPVAAAAGDINNDGLVDLVVACGAAANFTVLPSTGPASFAAFTSVSTLGTPISVSLSDMNVDGNLDIAGLLSDGSANIYTGNGTTAFTLSSSRFVGLFPAALAAADVTGDGTPDLAAATGVASGDGSGVVIVDGTQPAASGAPVVHGTASNPTALALADYNSDGFPDLATASPTAGLITILRHTDIPPTGTLLFGSGTRGCTGLLGMAGSGIPAVGNLQFGIQATNAPPRTLGLLLITNAPDTAGNDLLGIGVLLHVDFVTATEVIGADIFTDTAGIGYSPAAIPPIPTLAGSVYTAAGIFLELTAAGLSCSSSPLDLVSSRGLSITIQP